MPPQPQPPLPADFAALLREMWSSNDPRFNAVLRATKAAGWTYQVIADAVGYTRQAAERAIRRPAGSTADLPDVPVAPAKLYPEPEPKPRPPKVDPAVAERLRALQADAIRVNGTTPAASPLREASRELTALLWRQHTEHHISRSELARTIGVTPHAVTSRFVRHGLLDGMPSETRYLGRSHFEAAS